MFPERREVAYYLGALHVLRGDRPRGEALLHEVAGSGVDPELARSADHLLVAVGVETARDLLNQGRLEEGIEALEGLRDRAHDPDVRQMVSSLLEEAQVFARRQAHVGEGREMQSLQERLDRAHDLLEANRLDEGEAVLREIRAASDDPQVLEVIDHNLAAVLLREILGDPADPGLEGAARDLLDALQEHQDRAPPSR